MEGLAAPSTQPSSTSSSSAGSCCSQLPFLELSRFMEACAQAPKQPQKAQKLEHFRKKNIDPIRAHADDLFQIYRLLCPDVRAACWRAMGGSRALSPDARLCQGRERKLQDGLGPWPAIGDGRGCMPMTSYVPVIPSQSAWGISLGMRHACTWQNQRASLKCFLFLFLAA